VVVLLGYQGFASLRSGLYASPLTRLDATEVAPPSGRLGGKAARARRRHRSTNAEADAPRAGVRACTYRAITVISIGFVLSSFAGL
jgi:hypothetical protein